MTTKKRAHPSEPPPSLEESPAAAPSPPVLTQDATAPAAKAAHCAKCGVRFVPTSGDVCPACVAAETKRREKRAGYTVCRTLKHVVAVGAMEDGHLRTAFAPGEVAEFSDEDILSLPDHFEAV